MAFKTLEQRFNERVETLYAGAKTKYDGGKPSTAKNAEPFILRAPGESSKLIKLDSRGTPVFSGPQDVIRLSLFQTNKRGLIFLAKQQLLQTGNTFETTRLVNPSFVLTNAIPFIHARRDTGKLASLSNLKSRLLEATGLSSLSRNLASTDTSYNNVKKLGQLQVTTFNNIQQKVNSNKTSTPVFYTDLMTKYNISSPTNSPSAAKKLWQKITSSQILSPVINTLSAVNAKTNVGDGGTWEKSRPEISAISEQYVDKINKLYFQSQIELTKREDAIRITGAAIPEQSSTNAQMLEGIQTSAAPTSNNSRAFIKYFVGGTGALNGQDSTFIGKSNAKTVAAVAAFTGIRKISYIKDPSNITQDSGLKVPSAYRRINGAPLQGTLANGDWDDPVNVSFAMGADDPIRFRALIKNLSQTVDPKYSEYQYIGRLEKFINYTGIQRQVSFKLGVIAFSKDEIEGVWRRINYLTGLAYPYSANKGLLQPNIVRMTLGNVYMDQPMYIVSMNTNFEGITSTWEIDKNKQVPISAEIDMRVILIEKAGLRVADSPFYGITEGMSGFNNLVNTPQENIGTVTMGQPVKDPSNDPPSNSNVVTSIPIDTRKLSNPILRPQEAASRYFAGQPMFSEPISKLTTDNAIKAIKSIRPF